MYRKEGVIKCENSSKRYIFLETESPWDAHPSVEVIWGWYLCDFHNNIYKTNRCKIIFLAFIMQYLFLRQHVLEKVVARKWVFTVLSRDNVRLQSLWSLQIMKFTNAVNILCIINPKKEDHVMHVGKWPYHKLLASLNKFTLIYQA